MMEQLVSFPTQEKGNILDLIVTNIPERFEDISEHGRLGRSDHTIIVAKVRVGGDDRKKGPLPDWRRADWEAMRAELQEANITMSVRGQGAEDAWNTIRSKVDSLLEKHIPKRRERNSNRPAWLTQDILREIRKKKRIWKACRGRVTDKYKAAEKKVKNMIRNAKRRFEKKLAEGNNANKRPFYAYVKLKTQSRPSIGPLKNEDGQTVTSDEGMAEILNKAFQEVFTRESTTNIPVPETKSEGNFLENLNSGQQK